MAQEVQKVIGIDGCRSGWCASIAESGSTHIELFGRLKECFEVHWDASLVLIDMPVGLSDGQFTRKVDSRLRRLLKPSRHQSVFTPPCRESLQANDFQEALQINRRVTGKGISLQSWHLAPKIKELDLFLQELPEWNKVIYESHPETCFYFLNGQHIVPGSKKTAAGRDQRLAILKDYDKVAKQAYLDALQEFKRSEVRYDDLIDALCLCQVARMAQSGMLQLLEDEDAFDSRGIPVRIACPLPSNILADS